MAATDGPTSLFGRDREVQALCEAIEAAAAGHGQVVMIEGEPGIGKTRLVERAAQHAHASGFEVFVGACDDLVSVRPFAALVEASTPSRMPSSLSGPLSRRWPAPRPPPTQRPRPAQPIPGCSTG